MDTDAKAYALKGCSAWACVAFAKALTVLGISSWGEAASFLAAIYTVILIGEWVWKKLKK